MKYFLIFVAIAFCAFQNFNQVESSFNAKLPENFLLQYGENYNLKNLLDFMADAKQQAVDAMNLDETENHVSSHIPKSHSRRSVQSEPEDVEYLDYDYTDPDLDDPIVSSTESTSTTPKSSGAVEEIPEYYDELSIENDNEDDTSAEKQDLKDTALTPINTKDDEEELTDINAEEEYVSITTRKTPSKPEPTRQPTTTSTTMSTTTSTTTSATTSRKKSTSTTSTTTTVAPEAEKVNERNKFQFALLTARPFWECFDSVKKGVEKENRTRQIVNNRYNKYFLKVEKRLEKKIWKVSNKDENGQKRLNEFIESYNKAIGIVKSIHYLGYNAFLSSLNQLGGLRMEMNNKQVEYVTNISNKISNPSTTTCPKLKPITLQATIVMRQTANQVIKCHNVTMRAIRHMTKDLQLKAKDLELRSIYAFKKAKSCANIPRAFDSCFKAREQIKNIVNKFEKAERNTATKITNLKRSLDLCSDVARSKFEAMDAVFKNKIYECLVSE